MTLLLHLPDELERRLRARAARGGRGVEQYVLDLIQRDAVGFENGPHAPDALSLPSGQAAAVPDEEFEHLLDDLASGEALPHLPADFSRADIYDDHD